MNVTDDHFPGDFLQLDKKFSCFQIATELSFQDGELVFNELSSSISDVIELESHFLTVSPSDNFVLPGTDRDDRIGMKVISDLTMNCFRIVSPIHHIAL